MGSIKRVLEKQYAKQMKNHWYETYWIVDMHGVITRPNHTTNLPDIDFYPLADLVLFILSAREDIRLILYTSSYPEQRQHYIDQLERMEITFDYINENPEIRSYEDFGYYEEKPYFDVYLDDKAGFDPETEWIDILEFLMATEEPPIEWKNPLRRRLTKEELEQRGKIFVKDNIREQLGT